MKYIFLKIMVAMIIFLTIFSVFFNVVHAAGVTEDDLKIFPGSDESDTDEGNRVKTVLGEILNIVRIAGFGIALIILIVIGIKYMMSSAGERADIKKYAITYLIGILVFFGATGIVDILQNFAP